MNQFLEGIIGVSAVDNGTIGVLVVCCLGTEFATEELVDLSWGAMQTHGNLGNVLNLCFDTISGSLDLSIDRRHFVAVGWVINRSGSGDIDNCSSTNRHGEEFLRIKWSSWCLLLYRAIYTFSERKVLRINYWETRWSCGVPTAQLRRYIVGFGMYKVRFERFRTTGTWFSGCRRIQSIRKIQCDQSLGHRWFGSGWCFGSEQLLCYCLLSVVGTESYCNWVCIVMRWRESRSSTMYIQP